MQEISLRIILSKNFKFLLPILILLLAASTDSEAQDPVFSNTIYESGYYHPAADHITEGCTIKHKVPKSVAEDPQPHRNTLCLSLWSIQDQWKRNQEPIWV